MNTSETEGFDFAADDQLAGFRLRRLEVFNWGTFNGSVWGFDLQGHNALLTGDIGSGKSTLVDAVTTLLVPSQKVAYNKAAGAESRERTLRSYVQGYYKSERDDGAGSAKPVALRDRNTYSVILGQFHNEGYDQTVTLAQVFWLGNSQGQPSRFFCAAERALSIREDFSGFGSQMPALKRQLRKASVELYDSFPPYGAWYRRRFGIDDEQAMDLFHQTVSMKSVGNLTEFVRQHMLEAFDVRPRLDALIAHFDDLNRAHGAVLKARRQLQLLEPLITDCEKHADVSTRIVDLRSTRESLKPWFAMLKLELIDRRLELLAKDAERNLQLRLQLTDTRDALRLRGDDLRRAIADNGGDRLDKIDAEVSQATSERDKRLDDSKRFEALLTQIDAPMPEDEPAFVKLQERFSTEQEQQDARSEELDNQNTDVSVQLRDQRDEHEHLTAEITSLEQRRSNIPVAQIRLREALCAGTGLRAEDLPFVGELLQVREEAGEWEGAAERVLRSFGLSLLVSDDHYSQVSQWVDETHLRGRVVYYRVRTHAGSARSRRDTPMPSSDSLVNKLLVHPDTPFRDWLNNELAHRFDYTCCESQQQFHRELRAITVNGQTKGRGERHEKDDTHRIDDRSRYVLGWSNEDKLSALKSQREKLEATIQQVAVRISSIKQERDALTLRLRALAQLQAMRHWTSLDWQSQALLIDRLTAERAELEATSDVLRSLNSQLTVAREELGVAEASLDTHQETIGKTNNKIETARQLCIDTLTLLRECAQLEPMTLSLSDEAFDNDERLHWASEAEQALVLDKPRLSALLQEALDSPQLTVESVDNRQSDMREWLQQQIDNEERTSKRVAERIVRQMSTYKSEYPLDTDEVDASLESADEFRTMFTNLQANDLPRFESRFKELLNENTIREVANFQSQLNRERDEIRERIASINLSLNEIDYVDGRYIVLEDQLTTDADIRLFQSELRACTEGTLTGTEDDQYSEAKFLQVRAIIERFRGREGTTDSDRRWTSRVTDVRNWFVFAASERWRSDDTEHEHYTDSGGKSGGQKEKLAYTILAASLAYRFGLEWGVKRSRTFRFVVIDEAFGRGSDESADYGLRLFDKLNLQLLIVTPLQKIHIIEPYVSAVGYVANLDGAASQLRNLTIEEYRQERHRASLTRVVERLAVTTQK